ncbi:MAG TPA: ParA family protein [Stellaceae bacterium]|jgi:chromosome partitioning protein|nr:ParA family protein [Stellaceae bacterium]
MAKRRIIGVVSQKGGVGKSTLCQLIAREAAAQGKAAKILDFDVKQMSSVDWVRARLERDFEPAVEAEPTKDVRKALKLNRDYDVLVLDGAPGTPKRTEEMISECDLIVLPTGASRADLVPSLALARRIAGATDGAKGPFFALCRVLTDAEVAEARATIGAAGFAILDGELIERPGYRAAQNVGRSPSETNFSSLNIRAKKLAKAILERLD